MLNQRNEAIAATLYVRHEKNKMENTQIEEKVLEHYSELIKNENDRFESWEHCYLIFKKAFKKKSISEKEKDFLSLHLAFYLASWGMYRGSSFILQKDYKVFYPIIDLLFAEKNNFNENKVEKLLLFGDNDSIKSYISEYFTLDNKMNKILNNIRLTVNQKVASEISFTLKTKIILGTYGSIPAYDRFFQDGLRYYKNSDLIISYSKNGIFKIFMFAKNNLKPLKNIQNKINIIQKEKNRLNKINYPIMKVIDMYFWKIGFDLGEKK